MKKSIYEHLKNFLSFFRKMISKKSVEDDIWFEKLQSKASKIGARVHLIKIRIDYTRPYAESVKAGGPQTNSGSFVFKVADIYHLPENKIKDEVIVLLNWANGYGSYKKAVEWGLSSGLHKTTPYVPFAIGEQFPEINYEIGPNPMYIIETTGCTFDNCQDCVCCVWWYNLNRESDLCLQGCFADLFGGWFAFRKE